MTERLNVYDEEVINFIEREYKNRVDKAYGNSIKITKELVDLIAYYREHSFNQICDKIENIGKKTFMTLDDKTAYKQALYESYEKKYNNSPEFIKIDDKDKLTLINNEINKVLQFADDKNIKITADNYKNAKYNEYVHEETNKAQTLYELFNSIDAEEVKDYMSLFQDYKYSEELLFARISSIKAVAKKSNKDLPFCLVDEMAEKAVEKEVRHVVNVEELTDDNRSLKDRIKSRVKYALEVLADNSDIAVKASTFGLLTGGFAAAGTYALTQNTTFSIISLIGTSSLVITALGYGYKKIGIKDDTDSIEESKKLGLFDRKVRASQKERAFFEYDKYLKKKYTGLTIVGGNNGLHQ